MRIEMIRCVLIVLVVLFLAGCDGKRETFEPSGKVVNVGFVGSQTGEHGGLGSNSLDGAKAALQLQPYLLNGDRVEIVDLDDQNDPKRAIKAIDALIEEESIVAVLLGSASKTVLPVARYLDQIKLPGIALSATHPGVADGGYTVQLPFDDVLQGTVAALYVMDELIIDTVALFVEPEEIHSSFLAETFSKKFIEAGGDLVTIKYPKSNEGLMDTLSQLRDSGIKLLYLPINGAGVVEIQRMCRTLDFYPEVMLSDGILSRIILDHDTDLSLVEGVMATDVYTSAKITTKYREKISNSFNSTFSTPATTYAALGAEGMSILLQAMDRCGDSSDGQCINQKLHTTTGFIGVNGPISIKEDGKAERPIFINKIIDGKLVFEVMVY